MYCRYCGTELKSGENICTNCWQPNEPLSKPTPLKTCKRCGAVLKEGVAFCGKCGKKIGANSTIPKSSETASDILTTLKKPQTILWAHTLLSVGYVIYEIIEFVNVANNIYNTSDPFEALGGVLALGISAQLMKPHLILMGIAAVFSVLGIFMKRPWTYLTSAIIQTVGAVVMFGVLLAMPLWLLFVAVIIILGFVAYSQLKKG